MSIYRTTPSNPSPWICCIQCISHIHAEMCKHSFILEPQTSFLVGFQPLCSRTGSSSCRNSRNCLRPGGFQTIWPYQMIVDDSDSHTDAETPLRKGDDTQFLFSFVIPLCFILSVGTSNFCLLRHQDWK